MKCVLCIVYYILCSVYCVVYGENFVICSIEYVVCSVFCVAYSLVCFVSVSFFKVLGGSW